MSRLFHLGFAWTALVLLLWVVAGSLNGVSVSWQWLAWIPDTLWLIAAVPGLVVAEVPATSPARRHRLMRMLPLIPVGILLIASYGNDWKFIRSLPDSGFRIAYINAVDPDQSVASQSARDLLDWDADILIVANPGTVDSEIRNALAGDDQYTVARTHRFMVATNQVISSFRLRFAGSVDPDVPDSRIVGAVLEVKLPDDRPFRILVIDLPSGAEIDRLAVSERLQAFMESTESERFDLMIGDFNMTPRSSALAEIAGGNQDAFAVSGSGWGGTWTRHRPLLRLDYAMVRPGIEVLDTRTFDAGTTHLGILVTLGGLAAPVPRDVTVTTETSPRN